MMKVALACKSHPESVVFVQPVLFLTEEPGLPVAEPGEIIVVDDQVVCASDDGPHDFQVTVQFNDGPTFTRSLNPKKPQPAVIVGD